MPPDRAARDRLVLAHSAWARKLALATVRKLRLRLEPEDAVSAAFVALVEAAGRYKPGTMPFDGYAYKRIAGAVRDLSNRETVAHGRTREGVRRYREPDLDLGLLAWRLVDPAPGPLERAAAAEDRRRAVQLLATARRREREVLTMLYLEDLTQAEIGKRLGVTESRVCQIAGAGLKRIREGRLKAKMARAAAREKT